MEIEQNNQAEIKLELGIEKTMSTMLSAVPSATMLKSARDASGEEELYDFVNQCPPSCDEQSIYNAY